RDDVLTVLQDRLASSVAKPTTTTCLASHSFRRDAAQHAHHQGLSRDSPDSKQILPNNGNNDNTIGA
ncbi:hypothetical protein E4U50_001092, partial [Claviceps purpurea]